MIRQRSAQEIFGKQVGHLELFRMSVRDSRCGWVAAAPSPVVAWLLGITVLGETLLSSGGETVFVLGAAVKIGNGTRIWPKYGDIPDSLTEPSQ